MAKTELNEKLDAFFKKYENTPITEEIFDSSGFDIHNANEYGNLLHGVINYHYNGDRKYEFIDILFKKGINVNYKGESTGLTFIHLALYGCTFEDGKDYTYREDSIVKLILKARNYGLDVNIRDNDNEDIPTCAVASEIYRGSVIKIIEALGPDYDLPDDFLEIYHEYLKEAKMVNKEWYKRLEEELDAITDYVNKSYLNLDELNLAVEEKKASLTKATNDLDYETLTNSYENIHVLMEEIKKFLHNRALFEVDNSEYENYLDSLIELIERLLSKKLDSLEQNPQQDSLNNVKNIATCFNLVNLIKRVEEIFKSYKEYLDTLRNEAKNTKTINECNSMLDQIKESEIFEELKVILEANMQTINSAIEEAQDSYLEVKKMGDIASTFIEITDISEEQNYDDLTVEKLNDIVSSNQKTINSYKASLKDNISNRYEQLYISLKSLIDNDLLTQEDIENIFASTSKSLKPKEKKK